MKMAMTALAVVFLAGAAPAMAAPGDDDAPTRAEENVDRPHMDERPRAGDQRDTSQRDTSPRDTGSRDTGGVRERRDAERVHEPPRAPDAPRAAEPPRAVEAPRTDRGRVPGDSVGRPGPWTGGGPVRDDTRWGDGHGDRHDGDHHDGDRHDWNRHDNDRHDDRRHWERGRYPDVYFSSHRYHYRSWRPPIGYYVRLWSFGDFLPRDWYGQEYFLTDAWNFDLPLAPPGYDWVRLGDDALLVDRYTGRVVQVVRAVFW